MKKNDICVDSSQYFTYKIIIIMFLFSSILIGSATGWGWISLIFGIFAGIIAVKLQNSHFVPFSVILVLIFQNFLLGIGAHLGGNINNLTILTQIPTVYIWVVNLMLKRKWKLSQVDKSFLLLIFAIVFSLILGHGPIQSILANVRSFTTFYFSYRIGKRFITTKSEFLIFIKRILKLGVFVVLCGIVMHMGGYPLNKLLGINEVYLAKGVTLLTDYFDPRFSTDLFGYSVTRIGSLYYEPVNLGYLLWSIFIISFIYPLSLKIKGLSLIRLIILVGAMLTFGKGAMLMSIGVFVAGLIHLIFRNFSKNINERQLFQRIFLFLVISLFVSANIYFEKFGGAVGNHFYAIKQTWETILGHPIGFGLGTGGNAAALFSGEGLDFSTGSGTALLSFAYQIGIQGVLALFLVFYFISIEVLNKVKKETNGKNRFLIYIPMLLIFISLYQDNTFNPQCISLLMISLGGYTGYQTFYSK